MEGDPAICTLLTTNTVEEIIAANQKPPEYWGKIMYWIRYSMVL